MGGLTSISGPASRRSAGAGEIAGLERAQGFRRRIGVELRGPGRSRAEGRARGVAAVRGQRRAAALPVVGFWERARRTRLCARCPAAAASRVAFATLALGFLLGLGVLFAWRRTDRGAEPRRQQGAGRAAVREPGRRRGRVLRRRHDRRGARQARGAPRAPGHRQPAARPSTRRARRACSRSAASSGPTTCVVGKVRWEKRAGGQSRVRVSPELVEVASGRAPTTKWQAAVRRRADRRLPGAGRHRGARGRGARRRARRRRAAGAGGQARRRTSRPTTPSSRARRPRRRWAQPIPRSLRRAIGFYEQAVALDSAFAPAWAQLARAHALLLLPTARPPRRGPRGPRRQRSGPWRSRPTGPRASSPSATITTASRNDPAQALAVYAAGLRSARRTTPSCSRPRRCVEQTLGRWEAALEHLTRAQALDPRSVTTARRLARTLLWLRRYPEAPAAFDRALALAPSDLDCIEEQGDGRARPGRPGRRAGRLRAAPAEVEPAALVAFVATYWDLVWVLDDAQQRLLLGLGPERVRRRPRRPGASCSPRPTRSAATAQRADLRRLGQRSPSRSSSARRPTTHSCTCSSGSRSRTWAARTTRSREGERGVALLPVSQGCATRPLLPAPARAHLHPRRRAREGARPARAAAEDPVLPLARLAEDRPQLRPAAGKPPLPAPRRGLLVTAAFVPDCASEVPGR